MGGGKSDREAARELAQQQAEVGRQFVEFAKSQWRENDPYRKQVSKYWSDVIKGGPSLNRAVAPQLNQASRQYSTARKAIKELPPGGLRDISLRNASLEEAGAKTNIMSSGISDALARLANQANLGTQAGITGLTGGGNQFGNAAGLYSNLSQIESQSTAGLGAGIGSLVGMI